MEQKQEQNQEQEQEAFVYNVKVDDQPKKVIDLVFLKNYIEGIKLEYSMLSLDPTSVDKDDTVHMYLSKAAVDTLAKIEYLVDASLGLIKQPDPSESNDTEGDDSDDEVNVEDEVKQSEPKQEMVDQPMAGEQVVNQEPVQSSDDEDGRIVL